MGRTASVSVIVPTVGRASLEAAIASVEREPGDEILIVRRVPPYGHWGAEERDAAIRMAKGDYLAFLDDDDRYLPGHRAAWADAIARTPGLPVLFRMRYPGGKVLWREHEMTCGNVGSPMILVPNRAGWLQSRWDPRRTGDFHFINSWRWPRRKIVWREEIVAEVGHDEPPRRRRA